MNEDISKRVGTLILSLLLKHVLYLICLVVLHFDQMVILVRVFTLSIMNLLNSHLYSIAMIMVMRILFKSLLKYQRFH